MAITEGVTGVKTPTYIIVHELEATLTERALGPRPRRQESGTQGFSPALPVMCLTHSKFIKCLYASPDQGAQISFSLPSLNTAHDAAQGTAGWNTHLLTTAVSAKSSVFTHKNLPERIAPGLPTAFPSGFQTDKSRNYFYS